MPVEWVRAEKRHIRLLERFTCADPPKAQYQGGRFKRHPRPWEIEVQNIVRRTKPDRDEDEIWLGMDGEALVAVLMFKRQGSGYYVDVVARDSRHRGKGLGGSALELMVTLVKSDLETPISCHVHIANDASNQLMRDFGFECLDQEGDYFLWVAKA